MNVHFFLCISFSKKQTSIKINIEKPVSSNSLHLYLSLIEKILSFKCLLFFSYLFGMRPDCKNVINCLISGLLPYHKHTYLGMPFSAQTKDPGNPKAEFRGSSYQHWRSEDRARGVGAREECARGSAGLPGTRRRGGPRETAQVRNGRCMETWGDSEIKHCYIVFHFLFEGRLLFLFSYQVKCVMM